MPGALSRYRFVEPIGSIRVMADLGLFVNLADNSTWLRQSAFAPAAGYPRAASLEHLKAHSFSRASGSANDLSVQWHRRVATDGAGTFIMTDGVASTIRRSTDGGATWANVTINMGGPVFNNVVYRNGKFWLFVSTIDTLWAVESVTGATGTWTIRTVASGIGAGGATADCGDLDWTGTNYVAYFNGNGQAGVYTSPTGVVWTNRAAGANSADGSQAEVAAASSSGWVVVSHGSQARASSDHGVTWSNWYTLPGGTVGNYTRVRVVGNTFYHCGTGSQFYTSATPADQGSWALGPATPFLTSVNDVGWTMSYQNNDKSRIYWVTETLQLAYITASGDFRCNAMVLPGRTFANRERFAISATHMVMHTPSSQLTTVGVQWAASNPNNPNAIGFRQSATPGLYLYARIA
jgi:hypothetical protein